MKWSQPKMNNENNNSQKILKISNLTEIPQNYTGIIEWQDSDKWWFLNGKWHRMDGPAIENANGFKAWWVNGKRHRTDGPAIEYANGHKQWYLNGIKANPLFFEIPGCEKYVDYYMTILQTELVEHEEFLLQELKKRVEFEIKTNYNP